MKNLIFTPILILISVFTIAQNWSPIRVNQKMNYQHSDSSYISHTIWVDSVSLDGSDSVFYLNRVVKDVTNNPEIVLRNQPQFLKQIMIKEIYGIYSFVYPDQYWISTLSPAGSSWTFDLTNNLSAEILAVVYEDVFGVMDSVKTIEIEDGSQIRLSKNFGILQFPDFENGGYFDLVGIQGTPYGESIPGFWEIYDFEVGDVYQYQNYEMYWDGDGQTTKKITIDSKDIANNQITYNYHGIERTIYFYSGGGGGIETNYINSTITFPDSLNHPANLFPFQLHLLPISSSGYGTQRVFSHAKLFMDPEFGVISKNFGAMEDSYQFYAADVYYELAENSDTLYRFPQITLIDEPCGLKGYGYGANIGETFNTEGCFEYAVKRRLVGYVKDGDTVGIITPDSVLLAVSIDENYVKKELFEIYPNPASEVLHIKTGKNQLDSFDFELRNSLGEVVKKVTIIGVDPVIRLEGLTSGIYFYTSIKDFQILAKGKVLIR